MPSQAWERDISWTECYFTEPPVYPNHFLSVCVTRLTLHLGNPSARLPTLTQKGSQAGKNNNNPDCIKRVIQ